MSDIFKLRPHFSRGDEKFSTGGEAPLRSPGFGPVPNTSKFYNESINFLI